MQTSSYEDICIMKQNISHEDLCSNMSIEFIEFLKLTKDIGFEEEPPYDKMIELLTCITEGNDKL